METSLGNAYALTGTFLLARLPRCLFGDGR